MSFFQYVGYDSTAISRPIFCQNFTVPGLGLLWITLLLRKKLHNSAKDGLRNPAPSSKKNSRPWLEKSTQILLMDLEICQSGKQKSKGLPFSHCSKLPAQNKKLKYSQCDQILWKGNYHANEITALGQFHYNQSNCHNQYWQMSEWTYSTECNFMWNGN